MTKINRRVRILFDKFCIGYCRYYNDGICTKTKGTATLEYCPITEWLEMNEWITSIDSKLRAILKRVHKKFP